MKICLSGYWSIKHNYLLYFMPVFNLGKVLENHILKEQNVIDQLTGLKNIEGIGEVIILLES